jgi:hypothetical protein
MAQYYTDFTETINAVDRTWSLAHLVATENPGGRGFHDAWLTGKFSLQSFGGENVIRHLNTNNQRCALLWPSAGCFADVEAVCAVYVDTSTAGKRPGIVLRASGYTDHEYGYGFHAKKSTDQITISKYRDGTFSEVATQAYSFSTGWYWIRANITGGACSLRIWADGAEEPETWTLTYNDASPIASGFCGVMDLEGSSRVSYFRALRVVGTPLHPETWRWGWGDVAWTLPHVVADAECTGGYGLQMEQLNQTGRRLFVWDTVGAADEIRVLARFKTGATISEGLHLIRVRAQGYLGHEMGYYVRAADSSGGLVIGGYYRGTPKVLGTLASGSLAIAANSWYKLRFQAVGNALKAKVWPSADAEPGTWSLEVTDTSNDVDFMSMGQKGWFGIGSHAANTSILWDTISVGTAGDEPL